jgi:hypothetical protein
MTGFYPGDVSKLTKDQARQTLQRCAAALANDGTDFSKAWTNAKELNPGLVDRAEFNSPDYNSGHGQVDYTPGKTIDHTAGQYSRGPRPAALKPFKVAIPNDAALEALGLPDDCSYEEFTTASKANGDTDPRNSVAILTALISLFASRGINPDDATAMARKRFPMLASEFDQAIAEPSLANEQVMSMGSFDRLSISNDKRVVVLAG